MKPRQPPAGGRSVNVPASRRRDSTYLLHWFWSRCEPRSSPCAHVACCRRGLTCHRACSACEHAALSITLLSSSLRQCFDGRDLCAHVRPTSLRHTRIANFTETRLLTSGTRLEFMGKSGFPFPVIFDSTIVCLAVCCALALCWPRCVNPSAAPCIC